MSRGCAVDPRKDQQTEKAAERHPAFQDDTVDFVETEQKHKEIRP
jgi:hypothetical protein